MLHHGRPSPRTKLGRGSRVSYTLEVTDCFGRVVRLDRSNWEKHLAREVHLEVVPYHDRFPQLLTTPDVVIEAERDGRYHFYKKELTDGRYRDHYLHVVVGYDADQVSGTIRT